MRGTAAAAGVDHDGRPDHDNDARHDDDRWNAHHHHDGRHRTTIVTPVGVHSKSSGTTTTFVIPISSPGDRRGRRGVRAFFLWPLRTAHALGARSFHQSTPWPVLADLNTETHSMTREHSPGVLSRGRLSDGSIANLRVEELSFALVVRELDRLLVTFVVSPKSAQQIGPDGRRRR